MSILNKWKGKLGDNVEDDRRRGVGKQDSVQHSDTTEHINEDDEFFYDSVESAILSNLPDDENGVDSGADKQVPDYLLKREPNREHRIDYIKWSLLHGKLEYELAEEGYNINSIGICAYELEREGHRKRPPKMLKQPDEEPGETKPVKLTTAQLNKVEKGIRLYAKGSPPEALIDAISIPVEDGHIQGFEKGLKFGANMVVLGVRIAQELTQLGVQQAQPLIAMSKSMREGEVGAAKAAASEAAMLAAIQVQENLKPALEHLSRPLPAPEQDPMQAMMVRMLEPYMKNVMKGMVPGMGGMGSMPGGQMGGIPTQEQYQEQDAPDSPAGWTRKVE